MSDRLTPLMHEALQQAERGPLRRVHRGEGKPPWPFAHNTLSALVRRDLLDHGVDYDRDRDIVESWSLTDAGRLMLHPPPRLLQDRPMFLQRRVSHGGDYSPNPADAIDYDPVTRMRLESMTPGREWTTKGRKEHAEAQDLRYVDAQDRRERARRARAA